MTKSELLSKVLEHPDFGGEGLNAIITFAYYAGRERATKEVSDKYAELLHEQKSRANEHRFHDLAMKIQGDVDYIYSPDYSQDVQEELDNDICVSDILNDLEDLLDTEIINDGYEYDDDER